MTNPSLHPQSILIIHSGGIGDLLLALPAMRMFRRAFSRAKLELMGQPERLSLIAFDLQAESIHSVDQGGMAYFYLEGQPLPVKLSAFFAQFEVALVFGKSNLELFSRNLQRAGITRTVSIPSFPPDGLGGHVADYLCQCLQSEGMSGQPSFFPLRLPGNALAFGDRFWEENGLKREDKVLAIHPGSGSAAKNWEPKKFARVAAWAQRHSRIVLISGPAEKKEIAEVKQVMKEAFAVMAVDLPLIHLAVLIQRSTVYLGNDSGITHLAASLDIPTIALFGPTDPVAWGPRGPKVKIIYSAPPTADGRRPSL
ncbi:MAG: glycosyltransferase family 9 protein, partial [Deltaproteobacteria bacterium]|nr:glycosyltransferase family 9 protein [Deltaproteobacteria bacterium]